jgi:hypothetical protein
MTSIADLTRVCAPPTGTGTYDWSGVHADLGVRIPGDYRAIVNTYGPGLFGNFLWVMMPSDDRPRMSIRTQIGAAREAFQMLADMLGNSAPEAFPPYDVNALVPCAATNNGDTVYWITDRSTDPDQWHVTVQAARDPTWYEIDGSLLDFLVAVITGDYVCPVFPPEFPGSARAFTPLNCRD